jgi:sulfatase maturation enzyme AslB (radical SAM superfamily)
MPSANKTIKGPVIYQLWFSITHDCNNRCAYCFVEKNNKSMSREVIVNAFDLLLNSPGKNKKIIIFGGEPTLNLNLLEQIVEIGQAKAKALNKKLEFSLGTNAVNLTQKHLEFFGRNNFQLSVTLDGKKETHDKYRITKEGKPTYDKVVKNLRLLQASLPAERISCLLGIHYQEVDKMVKNFLHIVNDLKIESVNIEPIQNHKWQDSEIKLFEINLIKILKRLLSDLSKKHFYFINSLNRILEIKLTENKGEYPYYKNFVVFSDGQITINPFLYYIDNKYIVGDVFKGIADNCQLYDGRELSRDIVDCKIISIRDYFCEKMANFLILQASNNKLVKHYIDEALKRIFE